MDELKKKVMGLITQVNKDWEEMINNADENQTPINLVGMASKYSEKIQQLDTAFIEARERIRSETQPKKRLW